MKHIVHNNIDITDGEHFDPKGVYTINFNAIPDINNIYEVDGDKAAAAFSKKYADVIVHTHRYTDYDNKKKKYKHNQTLMVLNNNCVVAFWQSWCEILHNGSIPDFVTEVTDMVTRYKEKQRREPHEINLITSGRKGLELKSLEIKRTKLDIGMFYEDDFKEIDKVIQQRLKKDKDKGIVLLHGLPGTGKTTYLRYLIGRIKKRVLFVSPDLANNIMNPEFMELLIDNPNCVVIIEDAENVIMDRKFSGNSSVSNLLNLSDGLLADCLNIQLVCSFNSDLSAIDSALLRKGRLIAKYEFKRLAVAKAQQLSKHMGFDTVINKAMTIAEIANQHEPSFETKQHVIGFRREVMEEIA
ncbi:AAA family ATPase [Chitinophaga arvensicola]|uniref:ATPase family associated with various cellular activities (AAA) n=1 Tax=Chitinophaga arvensicola TaxID=29529 RepID=A0A1I0NR34_9BACT|nr:AAA family ATPase [Chitinophaga arvensicola]SEW03732.1 ATPase family associated with various cellular activities (AAA) [Chitinophaga arvensicola]